MHTVINDIKYRFEHCYPYLRIVRTTDNEVRVVRNGPATQSVLPALFEQPQDPEEIAGLDELLQLRNGRRTLELSGRKI